MLGDSREENVSINSERAGGQIFTELRLRSKAVSAGNSGSYAELLSDKKVKNAVTASPINVKNTRIKFRKSFREDGNSIQKIGAKTAANSKPEKNVSEMKKSVYFLSFIPQESNQVKDKDAKGGLNTFRNRLRNKSLKTSVLAFSPRKTSKVIQNQRNVTATNENRRTRSHSMAEGERTQRPFSDDNTQPAGRQFRISSNDFEHFVLPETNLIMDNISKTDIASLLGNPTKVEAITEEAGAVMKKLVTSRKFPQGSVSRHGQMDVPQGVGLNIKSHNLVPRNKILRPAQKYTRGGVTEEDEFDLNRTSGTLRSDQDPSPSISEQKNGILAVERLDNKESQKNEVSKTQFKVNHNSKKTQGKQTKISYSGNSEVQLVERTESNDSELVSVETPAPDSNDQIVVHEPDRQAQLVAEALSTLPPSHCCLQNWHVLPHNQKLGQDYLQGGPYAEQVSDYDEAESYFTQPRGQLSEINVANDTLLVYGKSDNGVRGEKYFGSPKKDVPAADRNSSRVDIEDSVSSKQLKLVKYSHPGLVAQEEVMLPPNAYTNDRNKADGGRWVDEVWIPNTDLPSTSAFYFTTIPSYSPKSIRRDSPSKIEEITASRKLPSRQNYFLRKLVTGSGHKREEAERSWRGFILSEPRREQEDDFRTDQSPKMMRKRVNFLHRSEVRLTDLSPEMFYVNETKFTLNPHKKEWKEKFPSHARSAKSDLEIAAHQEMKEKTISSQSKNFEQKSSHPANLQNVMGNGSMKLLRRSVSPNRRKLSSNSNSTLLPAPAKTVNFKHLYSKHFPSSVESSSASHSSQDQYSTAEKSKNYNDTENEEIVAINYDDFQVKEVPLPFETEPRYQIAFRRRTLLQWDYSRPAFFPWRGVPDYCSNYPVRFLKPGSAPSLLLVSFPGSGNTWLRYLTEALTGAFTGSFYADPALEHLGMWGEAETPGGGTTILQKTHSPPLSLYGATSSFPQAYQVDPREPLRVVLLIRSPMDAIVALRHYHAAGHTGFGQQWYFHGADWAAFTSEKAAAWFRLYEAWLQWRTSDLLVLHYEEMKEDPRKEALRLLKFIGVPLDPGRLECSIRYPEGKFKRPSYPKHMQGYTVPSNVSEYLGSAQRQLNNMLAEKNLPLIPFHLQRFFPSIVDTAVAFEVD
ncbi:Sulfotransferase domain [Trinorchestia longiramus]|nr:Sulfotransferase domain [Trinorchestia longiramus]